MIVINLSLTLMCYMGIAMVNMQSNAAMSVAEKGVAKLEWNSRLAWKEMFAKAFTNDYNETPMKPEETSALLKRLHADMVEMPSLGQDGARFIMSLPQEEVEQRIAQLDAGKTWPGDQESIWFDIFGMFKKAEKLDELIEIANVNKEKCQVVDLLKLQELFVLDYSQEYVNINPYLQSVRDNLFEFCGINLEHELRQALQVEQIPSSELNEATLLKNLVQLAGEPKPHQEISKDTMLEAVSDYVICRDVNVADSPKPVAEGFEELPIFSPVCSPIVNDDAVALRRYYDFFRENIDSESLDNAWRNESGAQNRLGLIRVCSSLQEGLVHRDEIEKTVNSKLASGTESVKQSCQLAIAAN